MLLKLNLKLELYYITGDNIIARERARIIAKARARTRTRTIAYSNARTIARTRTKEHIAIRSKVP